MGVSPGGRRGGGSARATGSSSSYCLSPDSTMPGWFDIGPDGVITVNGSLDREQLLEEDEEVKVQVTVSEGSTASFVPHPQLLTFDLCSL